MAKRPVRKKDESVKEYRARLAKWEAQQAGNAVRGAASAAGNFLMGKPKVGKPDSSLTAWRQNDASGTSSITGKKDKEKKTETTTTSSSRGPKRKPGATGGRGRGTSTYTVSGITYDSKTGRPVVVPKNRQPVKAQDNTKKDPPAGGGGSSSGSSGSSGGSSSSSSGSSSTPRRNGAGVKTPLSGGAGGTRPTGPGPKEKSKSRLEKALSGIGKWEEPKKKETRKKPTSRFLKKTDNTRRKER